MVRRGLERCNGHNILAYLEHLLDAIWLDGRILVDVGTKDDIGVRILLSLLAHVVSELLEDSLGHIGVQVVYENSFRHFILNYLIIFTMINAINLS